MPVIKSPKADLRIKYRRFWEISLIISLAALIAAFKYFPHLTPADTFVQTTQDLFKVEDIQQTKQENRPPPPPKPAIPIAAPSAEILQDVNIASTELDVNADVGAPPPPPPKKEIADEPVYFKVVEELPEPIGGIEAIHSKIKYPEFAKRAGVEGQVYVKAYVDKEGNVNKTELVKGIGGGCDEEAEKAVSETKFKPGKQRGKPVNVQVLIRIIFKIQGT